MHRLVRVFTCQNGRLLEFSCRCSYADEGLSIRANCRSKSSQILLTTVFVNHFDSNHVLVYEYGTLSQTREVCEVIFFGTSSKVNQVIYKSTHHLFSTYHVSMAVAYKLYKITGLDKQKFSA